MDYVKKVAKKKAKLVLKLAFARNSKNYLATCLEIKCKEIKK